MRAKRVAFAGLFIFLLAACHKRTAVVTPRVPASPPPAAVALEEGDRAFTASDYEDACRAYEDYLRLAPSRDQHDQVLFRLGLSYALRKSPRPDWQRATTLLRQLMNDYPNSPFKPPAELILALRSEVGQVNAGAKQRNERIKQLSTELDRLKKIDAERRKRP
jgi:outer membrane protein assembly factor BamD (BamD/ComL family)